MRARHDLLALFHSLRWASVYTLGLAGRLRATGYVILSESLFMDVLTVRPVAYRASDTGPVVLGPQECRSFGQCLSLTQRNSDLTPRQKSRDTGNPVRVVRGAELRSDFAPPGG